MTTPQTDELLDEVQAMLREREREGVRGLADRVGPAEWADLVPRLEPNEVAVLLHWLPEDEIPQLLEELPPADAARILRTLSASQAALVLEGMDPDDATDVVGRLSAEDAQAILVRMRPGDAAEIRDLGTYPPDSAGGLMTPAYAAVSAGATAAQAIAAIRRLVDDAETVN